MVSVVLGNYSDFQNYIPLQSVGVYRKALWTGLKPAPTQLVIKFNRNLFMTTALCAIANNRVTALFFHNVSECIQIPPGAGHAYAADYSFRYFVDVAGITPRPLGYLY